MKIRKMIAALMITPVFPYAAIVAIVGGYGLSDVVDCLKLTWRNANEE